MDLPIDIPQGQATGPGNPSSGLRSEALLYLAAQARCQCGCLKSSWFCSYFISCKSSKTQHSFLLAIRTHPQWPIQIPFPLHSSLIYRLSCKESYKQTDISEWCQIPEIKLQAPSIFPFECVEVHFRGDNASNAQSGPISILPPGSTWEFKAASGSSWIWLNHLWLCMKL